MVSLTAFWSAKPFGNAVITVNVCEPTESAEMEGNIIVSDFCFGRLPVHVSVDVAPLSIEYLYYTWQKRIVTGIIRHINNFCRFGISVQRYKSGDTYIIQVNIIAISICISKL